MIERESECNGCAECVLCGRKHRHKKYVRCDGCGVVIEDEVYEIDGKHYCDSCILDMFYGFDASEINE